MTDERRKEIEKFANTLAEKLLILARNFKPFVKAEEEKEYFEEAFTNALDALPNPFEEEETKVKLTAIEIASLKQIIDNEIEEVRVAIDNELLWAIGSEDEDQQLQHRMNAYDLMEYTSILQYYLDNGVFAYDKEIHEFWIKKLLEEASSKEESK